MPRLHENLACPRPTRTRAFTYVFTEKHHHGPTSKGQANWLLEVALADEFWIFEEADQHNYVDDGGDLFGMLKTSDSRAHEIGTRGEQVAIFYQPTSGNPWHGHPSYPIANQGQKGRPHNLVFARMVETRLLTVAQARRLKKGSTI
jgi:hypothetical protein